jgi:hypothetical protein
VTGFFGINEATKSMAMPGSCAPLLFLKIALSLCLMYTCADFSLERYEVFLQCLLFCYDDRVRA